MSAYTQLKKAKPALIELVQEKQLTLVKVYEEHDAVLVKFAKRFVHKLKLPGSRLEFVKVPIGT